MKVSTPYEATGRTHQKARTKAALVAAARELLAAGVTPTVEQAADRAAVARTTAYRYFTNQRALLIAAYPSIDLSSLLGADAPADLAARVALLVERFTALVLQHEPELRAMLRLSLESPPPGPDALPLRRGRAIRWIEDAVQPLKGRVPPAKLRRLVLAIRACIGIEALVWLCDVAQLSRDEAVTAMKWSAQALVDATLRDARLPGTRRSRRVVK